MLARGPFIAEVDLLADRIALTDKLGRAIEFTPADLYDLERLVRDLRLAYTFQMQCDAQGNRPVLNARFQHLETVERR